jgi:DNA-binding NtrC family response regulator
MENYNSMSTNGNTHVPNGQVFIEVMRQVDQIAGTNLPVLMTGATGAGKALVASAIHQRSSRRDQPFASINCATTPAELIETELFAQLTKAAGGTLFLDEIMATPASFQETLLHALQTGEIRRTGSDQPQHIDVRVIAASGCNLEQAVADGRFSADLFHYLSTASIVLPPSRTEPANDDWVTLSVIEGRYVARVLEHTCGNKQAAARLLAVDRKTLDRMIKRHHIDSHHVKALRAKASARN